jgi:hypothetical protein
MKYLFSLPFIFTLLAGCNSSEPPSLDQLGECARAITLEAEAVERLERLRNNQHSELSDRLASQAYMSAARYRAAACLPFPPDEFVSQ